MKKKMIRRKRVELGLGGVERLIVKIKIIIIRGERKEEEGE